MFIDANIFIIAALGKNSKARKCREFLRKIEKGEQKSFTSVLVLDEVLNSIEVHTGSVEKAISGLKKFLMLPNLKICEVNAGQLADSLQFFKKGLRPRDALHVAAMREHGISTILSYDKDFDSIEGIKRMEP